MGYCTITEAIEEGQYTVEIDYGSYIINPRKDLLAERITDLDASIIAQEAQYQIELAVDNDLSNDVTSLTTAYINAPEENKAAALTELSDAIALSLKQKYITSAQKRKGQFYEIQRASAVAELARLEALAINETRDVWCTDYTTAATGEVGTIEIQGEQPTILIAPAAARDQAADGQFLSRDALSPEASYLNAAILPGWQKFSPTYRLGSIQSINRDLDQCSVLLDGAVSSVQNLNINQDETLFDVPIEYMDCNSLAFSTFDRVVVQFSGQDWEQPKVIGFEKEPKPCVSSPRIRFNRTSTAISPRRYLIATEAIHNNGEETPSDRIWNKMYAILTGSAPYYTDPTQIDVQYRENDTAAWIRMRMEGYGVVGGQPFAYSFRAGSAGSPALRWNNYSETWFDGQLSENEGQSLESDCLYWFRGADASPPRYHYFLSTTWSTASTVQEIRILVDEVEEFRIAHVVPDHKMFNVNLVDQLLDTEYGNIKNTGIAQTQLAPYEFKP